MRFPKALDVTFPSVQLSASGRASGAQAAFRVPSGPPALPEQGGGAGGAGGL